MESVGAARRLVPIVSALGTDGDRQRVDDKCLGEHERSKSPQPEPTVGHDALQSAEDGGGPSVQNCKVTGVRRVMSAVICRAQQQSDLLSHGYQHWAPCRGSVRLTMCVLAKVAERYAQCRDAVCSAIAHAELNDVQSDCCNNDDVQVSTNLDERLGHNVVRKTMMPLKLGTSFPAAQDNMRTARQYKHARLG